MLGTLDIPWDILRGLLLEDDVVAQVRHQGRWTQAGPNVSAQLWQLCRHQAALSAREKPSAHYQGVHLVMGWAERLHPAISSAHPAWQENPTIRYCHSLNVIVYVVSR